MNTTLILTFSAISFIALILFWMFYRKSNSTQKLTQSYLIEQLKNTNLTDVQRNSHEQQLSKLLMNQSSPQNSFKIVLLFTVFAIPLSFLLYNKLGNPMAVDNSMKQPQKIQASSDTKSQPPQMSMQDAIAQLEQRLAQNPNDVDGQMLYARSLVSMKKYAQAVTAYRKSNELAPNESVILTELAEAIALANNNRSFLGEPEGLLAKAVELEPNNQKALWLLGMTYYEHKDYVNTNKLWTRLYDMLSDEGAKKQLSQQLNDIRAQLDLTAIEDKSKPQVVSADNAHLEIKILLDEKLKTKLKGKRALLYIYAKEPTGMPMPIAVIRKPLEQINNDFPIVVSMNNSNSLQSTRMLSDFKQIKLGARISFTGNATPQVGDFEAAEQLIKIPQSDSVQLIINSIR